MRALKQLIGYRLIPDCYKVTTQAREGIETISGGWSSKDAKVTTQAREGIETSVLFFLPIPLTVTTQAREGIETTCLSLSKSRIW